MINMRYFSVTFLAVLLNSKYIFNYQILYLLLLPLYNLQHLILLAQMCCHNSFRRGNDCPTNEAIAYGWSRTNTRGSDVGTQR